MNTKPTMNTAMQSHHSQPTPIPVIRPKVAAASAMLDAHFRRLELELGKCLVGLSREEIESVVLLKLNVVRRAYRDELNASTLIP